MCVVGGDVKDWARAEHHDVGAGNRRLSSLADMEVLFVKGQR